MRHADVLRPYGVTGPGPPFVEAFSRAAGGGVHRSHLGGFAVALLLRSIFFCDSIRVHSGNGACLLQKDRSPELTDRLRACDVPFEPSRHMRKVKQGEQTAGQGI